MFERPASRAAYQVIGAPILLMMGALVGSGCSGQLGGGLPGEGVLPRDAGAGAADLLGGAADAPVGPRSDAAGRADAKAPPQSDTGTPHPPAACTAAIAGARYELLSVNEKTDRPAEQHGDVNLLLRKWRAVTAQKGLVDINGPTDHTPPPQLFAIFSDERVPAFASTYQVESWDWGCNCAKGYVTSVEVSLAGMQTQVGEVLRAPSSGYNIGDGYTAVVLLATPTSLTIKYTREDNVVRGYTVHLAGLCVEPSLLALYQQANAAGRAKLPALRSKQPIGRASGAELVVSIRDTGSWMDPRARKDWWQGK